MKRLAILVTLLSLAACGGATPVDTNGDGIADPTTPFVPDQVTVVAPVTPKGHVYGRVQTMQGAGLSGVTVTISGTTPPATVTTADGGYFLIDKLTAGSTFGLFFSMTGYAPAWTYATIPAAAGNFPLDGAESFIGNVVLLPVTGSITFYLVGYDGKPVDAVTSVLDVTPGFVINRATPASFGDISVTAAAAAGTLTFTAVPKVEDVAWMSNMGVNVTYSVYVPPVYDSTQNLLYGGKVFALDAKTLLTQPWTRTLVLPAPTDATPLTIVATNVANLMSTTATPAKGNLVTKTGPLYVVFNQPIAKDVFVEVRSDDASEKDSATVGINPPALNALGTEMQVTFKTTPGLVDGQKYNLTIQASSRDNAFAKPVRFTAPFFGGDPAASKQLGATVINLMENKLTTDNNWQSGSEEIDIIFDKYIGRVDANPAYNPSIPIYFDNDLDNSGTKGDSVGEKGFNTPICVQAQEPVPAWLPGARASSYSRKFVITPGQVPTGKVFAASELSITVAFSEAYKCNGGLFTPSGGPLESVWGEPLTQTFNTLTVTAVPPP